MILLNHDITVPISRDEKRIAPSVLFFGFWTATPAYINVVVIPPTMHYVHHFAHAGLTPLAGFLAAVLAGMGAGAGAGAVLPAAGL